MLARIKWLQEGTAKGDSPCWSTRSKRLRVCLSSHNFDAGVVTIDVRRASVLWTCNNACSFIFDAGDLSEAVIAMSTVFDMAASGKCDDVSGETCRIRCFLLGNDAKEEVIHLCVGADRQVGGG